MKRAFSHWLPFVFVLFAILFLSTLPRPVPVEVGFSLNFLHPLEFFVLSFLLLRLFHVYGLKYKFVLTILLIVLIAFVDEYIQGFTPGRTSSLSDVFLDFIGGCFIFLFKNKKLSKFLGVCGYKNYKS